jgi:acetyl/propionyl-CoA carboxylase alpha subunit
MNEKEIIFLGPPSVVISALGHKTGSSLMSKQQ